MEGVGQILILFKVADSLIYMLYQLLKKIQCSTTHYSMQWNSHSTRWVWGGMQNKYVYDVGE